MSQGFIRNKLSQKCIDVAGAPGRSNGAQLQLWDCEILGINPDNGSLTDQKWSWTR
ncbi:MAG: ricin-type beta-trefoil lectin domain protein [Thioploca sp.]|nr:ricin-type beta-trefoil lectin domain protein [Thioploca sp.]